MKLAYVYFAKGILYLMPQVWFAGLTSIAIGLLTMLIVRNMSFGTYMVGSGFACIGVCALMFFAVMLTPPWKEAAVEEDLNDDPE